MISLDMKLYNYSTLGNKNSYGQVVEGEVEGQVKMAINLTSQSVQDNINYKDCQYLGLTFDSVDDTYIIHNGEERLKVLYVNPKGRYTQVFLKRM